LKKVIYSGNKKGKEGVYVLKWNKMVFTSLSISLLAFIYLGKVYFSQTKRKHQF